MTETVAQERLRAKRSREAHADRALLEAAHTAENAREMVIGTWTAAQAKAGIDVPDLTAEQIDVMLEAIAIAQAPDPLDAPDRADGRYLRVTKASKVRTRRVLWEIDDWIPRGSLVLLAGREGLGKSTIACSWAAQHWTKQGRNVIYVHTEDSREHTVVPRLKAAGADLDRVLFVDVATETTETGTVILPMDNDRLEALATEHEVGLIVLDAATSAMASALSGRDDRQVRQFLEPLAQMAARLDIVVLGLVHFGKRDGADTGKLILGSIAWSQVARSVLSVAYDDEAEHLVVTNTKSNLATRTRSEACRVASATVQLDDGTANIGTIEWLGEVERDARDLLMGEDERADSHGRSELRTVLRDFLIDMGGQAPAAEVLKAMRAAGFDDAAVKKIRGKAGVKTRRTGFGPGAGYVWTIEDAPAMDAMDSMDTHTRENESMEPMRESMAEGTDDGEAA